MIDRAWPLQVYTCDFNIKLKSHRTTMELSLCRQSQSGMLVYCSCSLLLLWPTLDPSPLSVPLYQPWKHIMILKVVITYIIHIITIILIIGNQLWPKAGLWKPAVAKSGTTTDLARVRTTGNSGLVKSAASALSEVPENLRPLNTTFSPLFLYGARGARKFWKFDPSK